ncbi:MAG: GNAT family N-acetyltransferase [archaeon]
MSFESLRKIFDPKSVAVIGASDREGSIGATILKNMTTFGFKGPVYPVNPRKPELMGLRAYAAVSEIPGEVDLAIIATPAATVPDIVEECGRKGIEGVIIISAGFKEIGVEGKALEDQISRIRQKYNMRIVGPNCLGVMRPRARLNATFAGKMVIPGKVAFVSQSGALCTSILDWAVPSNVGFSAFVSIGSMLDVDFGDLIDYFGDDPETRSIILYVEAITDAREFMSAARGFARTKPIIVVKSGRFSESASAATSHTGALAGEDAIYDAAFRRAGIVRVDEIADLFSCSETLATQPLPKGPNLAIVGNAGGPNVMATDALIAKGGTLATLRQESIESLNKTLPNCWSGKDPVDLLADADGDRYRTALQVCESDSNVDGLLVIYTPQGGSDPLEAAKAVVEISSKSSKPILTSWMGEEDVGPARAFLRKSGVPTFVTPEQAVKTYLYMYQYSRRLELLYETPEEIPTEESPSKFHLKALIRRAAWEGRELLNEPESKRFLESYGIPVVDTHLASSASEAAMIATEAGYPVVMKIVSPQITHKSDVGGVLLGIESEEELRRSYDDLMGDIKKRLPDATILGVSIQKMVDDVDYELILGSKRDDLFGSVILFGSGGIGVEVFADRAIGLPPLNQVLARRLMEQTRVYKILRDGLRNRKPANMIQLEEVLMKFSQLVVDFPEIREIDVNPLVCGGNRIIALDARVIIDKKLALSEPELHQHLVISPYPAKYTTEWKARDGRQVLLRPIKPEDEPMWLEMFKSFSEQTVRNRFFYLIKDTPHETRIRYCNIDYDREIAIVGEILEQGRRKIIGVVRLVIDRTGRKGEFAIAIADPWQGIGVGSKMVDYMIGIAEDKKLDTIYGVVLPENIHMLRICREMGFRIEKRSESEMRVTLDLHRHA